MVEVNQKSEESGFILSQPETRTECCAISKSLSQFFAILSHLHPETVGECRAMEKVRSGNTVIGHLYQMVKISQQNLLQCQERPRTSFIKQTDRSRKMPLQIMTPQENKKDDHINKFQLMYKKYSKNKLKQDKQKQSFDS